MSDKEDKTQYNVNSNSLQNNTENTTNTEHTEDAKSVQNAVNLSETDTSESQQQQEGESAQDSVQTMFQQRLNIPCKHDGCNKLNVYNWLKNLPKSTEITDIVEIRFKNTRKGYYKNINELSLQEGDIVAVEASPGHDIGMVSLTGELVYRQLKKYNVSSDRDQLKKIYRKAKQVDIEKWKSATAREHDTMLKARQIALDLNLNMKIADVEYQGDGTKAIFYYIADERVDFRELIKVLAEEFKIRVEMKQIGARQEAGRVGGIGSCGRELCCAKWITNFVSVTTDAARSQELSLNPQKLAGQCGKLKCCLNYELDIYKDAKKNYPPTDIPLKTKEGDAYHQKTDIFKELMFYSTDPDDSLQIVPLPIENVRKIQELNKNGTIIEKLEHFKKAEEESITDYENVVGQESVTRFDAEEKPKNKKKRRNKRKQNHQNKNK